MRPSNLQTRDHSRSWPSWVALCAVLFCVSGNAVTVAGPIEQWVHTCSKAFSPKPKLTEAQELRRLSLLRILINFRAPLTRLAPSPVDGVAPHAQSVFRDLETSRLLFTFDPAPMKSILKIVRWIEDQGDDFAWQTHDRLLELIQDSLHELETQGRDRRELKELMYNKLWARFDFYFDQDPTQIKPTYLNPSIRSAEETAKLRSQGLDRIYTDLVLQDKRATGNSVLAQNHFVVDRGRLDTRRVLGYDVFTYLDQNRISGSWYDIGSGLAKLQRERLRDSGPPSQGEFVAVSLVYPQLEKFVGATSERNHSFNIRQEIQSFDQDVKRFPDVFRYLSGAFVEDRTDLPEAAASLVTDVLGALSYTHDWKRVVLAEARLLKPGGLLVSHRTPSQVLTPDGRLLDWFEVAVRYGTGLKLKKVFSSLLQGNRAGVILERTKEPLTFPDLELLFSCGSGTPPKQIYYCAECGK